MGVSAYATLVLAWMVDSMLRQVMLLTATLMSTAVAQEARTLDPAGVQGIRYLMRDDAIAAATRPGADTLFDWQTVGLPLPSEQVTTLQIRNAFEGNAINAERRFGQPFIVKGSLHSVSRRADNKIVVRFNEGGASDGQRRAMAGLPTPNFNDIVGGMTGGIMHAGAQAILPIDNEDAVANWKPGETVTLHCRKAVNVRLAVLLDFCVAQSIVTEQAEKIADAQSNLILERNPVTVSYKENKDKGEDGAKISKDMLFYGYFLGLFNKNCFKQEASSWGRCIKVPQANQIPASRREALRNQIARDLDIPELLTPARPTPAPPRRSSGTPR